MAMKRRPIELKFHVDESCFSRSIVTSHCVDFSFIKDNSIISYWKLLGTILEHNIGDLDTIDFFYLFCSEFLRNACEMLLESVVRNQYALIATT